MVGFGDDSALAHGEGVVIFAAPPFGGLKARAEGNALNGRNTEYQLRNAAFHAAEQGAAQSGRRADDGTFDHAAHGVALRLGGENGFLHGLSCHAVHHREGTLRRRDRQFPPVGNTGDLGNAADDFHALPGQ